MTLKKSSGDASGDGEPDEVEMVWGEWSGCSLSCGGGTKVRLLVDRPARNQTSVCNTNECPFDPLEKPGCSCPEGELACQESFTTPKLVVQKLTVNPCIKLERDNARTQKLVSQFRL